MNEFLMVLAFAALPALGNLAGCVLAEFVPLSRLALNLALYMAAGVVVAVVAVELMPRALEAEPAWAIVLAFVLGGVFYVTVDWAIQRLNDRFGGESGAGPWVIFFGVSVDLFSDGIMVGTGSTVAVGLGLLLALGRVPSDVPEGFATIANFRRVGVTRGRRLLLAAALAAPIFFGAVLGYWLMRDASELYQLLLLTFTAGVLSTLVVEELVPEAVEEIPEHPLSSLSFVGGFAVFTLLSVYLELG